MQTVVDVMLRFEDLGEGTYSAYDVMSYVMEDLIREGFCPACFSDALAHVCRELGVDPTAHRDDGGTVH